MILFHNIIETFHLSYQNIFLFLLSLNKIEARGSRFLPFDKFPFKLERILQHPAVSGRVVSLNRHSFSTQTGKR
jgi:hypothetical protein